MTSHEHNGGNGRPLPREVSVDGEGRLSAEVSADDFLDPTFLATLANAFYARGRPTELPAAAPSSFSLSPGETRVEGAAEVNAAATAWSPEGQEHLSLSGTLHFDIDPDGEEHATLLAELRNRLAPVQRAGGEAFYFLTPVPPPRPVQALAGSFPVEQLRQDFPILSRKVHGKPLIWMDNAATAQKPRAVIEAVARFYEHDNSNTHRAEHTLGLRATDLYESARRRVCRFLGAAQPEEIVFTRGATEAINLVAQSHGRAHIGKGDEIVLSTIEHHANIVPWQQLAHEKGAVLRVIPVNDRGEVVLEEYEELLSPRTRMVAITHASNAIGTVPPVALMTQMAHRHGARVLVDGAQAAPHLPLDVRALDCDFYVVAGHKMFAPTGVGVLYGKRALLDAMPPWQGGGHMMVDVTFEQTTYRPAPDRFEAGTGTLASVVGLGAAIEYLEGVGMDAIRRYEQDLLAYATATLAGVPGLRLIGTAAEKVAVLSFVLEGVRSEDMARLLDQEGIAVRVGRHCAHPTMRRFGVPGTIRPSLAFYNTHAEIDALAAALVRATKRI